MKVKITYRNIFYLSRDTGTNVANKTFVFSVVFVFICYKVSSIFCPTLRILGKESALPGHNTKPTLKSIRTKVIRNAIA